MKCKCHAENGGTETHVRRDLPALKLGGPPVDDELVAQYFRSELSPERDAEVREHIRDYRNWFAAYIKLKMPIRTTSIETASA